MSLWTHWVQFSCITVEHKFHFTFLCVAEHIWEYIHRNTQKPIASSRYQIQMRHGGQANIAYSMYIVCIQAGTWSLFTKQKKRRLIQCCLWAGKLHFDAENVTAQTQNSVEMNCRSRIAIANVLLIRPWQLDYVSIIILEKQVHLHEHQKLCWNNR